MPPGQPLESDVTGYAKRDGAHFHVVVGDKEHFQILDAGGHVVDPIFSGSASIHKLPKPKPPKYATKIWHLESNS